MLIAANIFRYIPATHFKNIRLVCTLWYQESIGIWRRTQCLKVITFHQDARRLEQGRYNLGENEEKLLKHISIGAYLSFYNDPSDSFQLVKFPFQKLCFYKSFLSFKSRNKMSNKILETFCTIVGPHLTSLTIEKCIIFSTEDFQRLFFQLSPHLKYLSLADNLYEREGHNENERANWNMSDLQPKLTYLKLSMAETAMTLYDHLPLTWTQFFTHFPNIQKLELIKLNRYPSDIQHILETIRFLQKECGILQDFTGLNILNLQKEASKTFDEELLATLRTFSFPLTFLAYDIGYEHNLHTPLNKQLEISAQTLETLVIYKAPKHPPFGNFPYGNSLPNLKQLILVGPIVKNLHFLEFLPSLKSLRLFHFTDDMYQLAPSLQSNPEVVEPLLKFKSKNYAGLAVTRVAVVGNTDFTRWSNQIFPNMEEFILGSESCTVFHVEQLARLMHNLKTLRIGLDDDGIRAVGRCWSGIRTLDVHPFMFLKVNVSPQAGVGATQQEGVACVQKCCIVLSIVVFVLWLCTHMLMEIITELK